MLEDEEFDEGEEASLRLRTLKTDNPVAAVGDNRREVGDVAFALDVSLVHSVVCAVFFDYGGDCNTIHRARLEKLTAQFPGQSMIRSKRLEMTMADNSKSWGDFNVLNLNIQFRLRGSDC